MLLLRRSAGAYNVTVIGAVWSTAAVDKVRLDNAQDKRNKFVL